LRPIKGALALAETQEIRFKDYSCRTKREEAALIKGIKIFGCESLSEAVKHFRGEKSLKPQPETNLKTTAERTVLNRLFRLKAGTAKRGLEIAAPEDTIFFSSARPAPKNNARQSLQRDSPTSFFDNFGSHSIHSVAGSLNGSFVTCGLP